MSYILMAALGIGFLIFIHELGHYICARMAGVRVEVFSLGFGQRLCGFVRNGTDYRLSLVPIGGYVRVAGEDPTRREHLRSDDLYAKGYLARFWFFSGGVIMNLLFALVAFPLVFQSGVKFVAPVVGAVTHGSPAWEAGIQVGDRVDAVGGKKMYSFNNLTIEVALGGEHGLEVELARGDDRLTVQVNPRYNAERGMYEIGIRPAEDPSPIEVRNIRSASPAYLAGVRDGDRILRIDGVDAVGGEAAQAATSSVWNDSDGPVTVQVERDGAPQSFTFVPEPAVRATPRIGVTAARRTVIGIRDHVPVLQRLGIARGDVILEVHDAPFLGNGLATALPTAKPEALELTVRRDGRPLALSTRLADGDRQRILDHLALGSDTDVVRIVPVEDSPAFAAGVQPGDQVIAVNGSQIDTWSDLTAAVQRPSEKPLEFTLRSLAGAAAGIETHRISITPTSRSIPDFGYDLRLDLLREVYRVESAGAAIGAGFTASVDLVKQLYVTLKGLFTGRVAAKNLGGIVMISQASYHFASEGWAVFLYFLALLSINLAFVNILPIPVLDGGHLLFLLIEMVKGSPVSARVLTYSQILGLVFVIALMLFVTYNDILRLL